MDSYDFNAVNVLIAYANGVFPMAHDDGVIYWYRPDPRAVLPLDRFHVSRSLERTQRRRKFEVRIDTDFFGVMEGCADREEGTWISSRFMQVYGELHQQGFAHSVEVWDGKRLVGGTYGISLGSAFMAESMFHRETDASKIALWGLVAHLSDRGYSLLDVQYLTPHLISLGAIEIPHRTYLRRLQTALEREVAFV